MLGLVASDRSNRLRSRFRPPNCAPNSLENLPMRRLFACFLLLFPIVAVAQSPAPESGFTPLFDGKSLQGWEGDANWFRVDDGAIVAGSASETIPNNFFLATTEQYEDFELRLEAKLVGAGQNAGVQFRTQRIPNHHEVSGYQADMGTAGGGSRSGARCTTNRDAI